MDIKIELEDKAIDPYVIIRTASVDKRVESIISLLSEKKITAHTGNKVLLVEEKDIFRIFAFDKKVYIKTEKETYVIKKPLYEIEKDSSKSFVRISGSEIINLDKVENFDFTLTGRIFVSFLNGEKTQVSRRFISSIKKRIGA